MFGDRKQLSNAVSGYDMISLDEKCDTEDVDRSGVQGFASKAETLEAFAIPCIRLITNCDLFCD